MVKFFISSFHIIGLMSRVFANVQENRDSIPGRVISKIQKMVLEVALLNIQHYNVWITGKVKQSTKFSTSV